jgi:hypothetical protein
VVLRSLIAASLPVIEAAQIRLIAHTLWFARPSVQRTCTTYSLPVLPAHLKNSLAAAASSVVAKVDPLEGAQSDANESGDGLRPPKLLHEKRESSFSTE